MVNLFGRNFEATTTKFCTHVDEHGVQRCIDFHKHRLMASCILKTIKLNFRLNTVFTSLTKIHMVTSVTQTYIQSNKRQKYELNRSSSPKYNCMRQRVPVQFKLSLKCAFTCKNSSSKVRDCNRLWKYGW